MNTLLENLYIYACENRTAYSQEDKLRYQKTTCLAEQAQKDILEMLTEKGALRFEDYTREMSILENLELKSIFRAGLSIGMELSRLQ